MKKLLFLIIATLTPYAFSNSNWTDAFETMWEMQWHQSGYPMNATKWVFETERKIHYSVTSDASNRNLEYANKALADIGVVSKIEFVRLDEADPKVQLELVIRRYSDDELRRSTCVTAPTLRGFAYTRVKVTMSDQHVWRCGLHELMHVMGLYGHPTEGTVLTYFGGDRTKLHETDKFILQHWNSDLIRPGMNVFRVVKLLNAKWIAQNLPVNEQAQAIEIERQWFTKMIAQMDAFADGKGEPPRILYRSGRLNEAGLKFSRLQIQGVLGVAYLEGFGVEKKPNRASELLLCGSQEGASGAIIAMTRGLVADKFAGTDMSASCTWIKTASLANGLTQVLRDEALQAQACAKP